MAGEPEKYAAVREVALSVLSKNLAVNGPHIIKTYVIEEAAELTKELTKAIRGKGVHEYIAGEMADMYYVLSLLRQYYGVSVDEINGVIAFKEARAKAELGIPE